MTYTIQLKTFLKKGWLRRWNVYHWVKKWYNLSSTTLSCYESDLWNAKLLGRHFLFSRIFFAITAIDAVVVAGVASVDRRCFL